MEVLGGVGGLDLKLKLRMCRREAENRSGQQWEYFLQAGKGRHLGRDTTHVSG